MNSNVTFIKKKTQNQNKQKQPQNTWMIKSKKKLCYE